MKTIYLALLVFLTWGLIATLGCHSENKPQDPVVVKPPTPPNPTPTPVPPVHGIWCVTGGGFSPCAPHNPKLDQPCSVGDSVESDCKMWGCKAACE